MGKRGVQDVLSAQEKLDILEGWIPPTRCVTSVEIPAVALRSFGNDSVSRIRVWARCRHVDSAVVGVPASQCNACAEEHHGGLKKGTIFEHQRLSRCKDNLVSSPVSPLPYHIPLRSIRA
ncbi:hypothetical protein KIN20_017642 [Parelaphostrongylus tenuis]|uniref:Uncharacterized protein n=1 Tax=Parelaphostrongylus tenuis TaxID=148309 RepID=A0AAD5MLU1_PARTN|nr:hypothetical protein KIN20_017642 [Parelaphostrongylus tenuis]